MPIFKRFDGFRVDLRSRDHNPPHFHAIGPDFHALVRISDLDILQGSITRRAYAEIVQWASQLGVKAALFAEWERLNERD